MAARRRSSKTNDLPPNLYCRNGYYSFRDPRTGKEYGLGRDKRYAVTQAIDANMTMMPEKSASLADRINGAEAVTFDALIEAFRADIQTRNLSPKTLSDTESKLRAVSQFFSGKNADGVDTRLICAFLDEKIAEGKKSMANILRITLSDIFKTAIAKGLVKHNPVADTRPVRTTVTKERLTLEEYLQIREAAKSMKPWVGLCFDLAVVTGQREGDLSRMRWVDIVDDKLCVVQQKTKTMLRISLNNKIEELNIDLGSVLESLQKLNSGSEFVLGGKGAFSLADAFRKARQLSGIAWVNAPPPFHELRSLSGRMYAKQKGKDFAKDMLGHKSSEMTDKYTDGRGKEWLDV